MTTAIIKPDYRFLGSRRRGKNILRGHLVFEVIES